MPANATSDWRKEFGIEGRKPPTFFSGPEDIDAAGGEAPLPHALRRAFEELKLNGVLCIDRAPVIYFRQVERIEPGEVARLHRLFWNQGVAPILVLVATDLVHIYSGLSTPTDVPSGAAQGHGFVQTLNRVDDELQRFILAVESGEYFRAHRQSFDPEQRVDRDLLRNLRSAREDLARVPAAGLDPHALDALLCRLVFTCYLFDREVIDRGYLETLGIQGASHLRDILGQRPRMRAKEDLYTLFARLSRDFNGDLFSDDLDAEGRQTKAEHLDILDRFVWATDVRSGQQSFWPYDFRMIPIETISAIYEHFLKAAGEEQKRQTGAFYTPRFLAEVVLDVALNGTPTLLDKRFLDPSCGSGIFLVGLFNRMAEEWRRLNPRASYLQRVKGLLKLLRENLFGVDKNKTACQITAFSLCLAFLDQLLPPDIRELQRKGKVLPTLVGGTIRCADFFTAESAPPVKAHFVIGNPPWVSVTDRSAPVARWCAERRLPFPDRQIATGFVWKATERLETGGKVCFVLPHGTLFNHSKAAIDFQREWFSQYAVELVLNLADYQRFLFGGSEAPALVVRYRKERPPDSGHRIDYWGPKADWGVAQAEIISILPQDRARLTVREVLDDLRGKDAPLIWKERFWATPRDWRLLDRLSLLARLRDLVGQPGRDENKRWLVAEGFQPHGENDPPNSLKQLTLPSSTFVHASSPLLNLFLLPEDCVSLPSSRVEVRRLIRDTDIFRAPHVLITQGFSRIAFADFHVAFRHAIRGLHGPQEDRNLLVFLTAYLRSALARFFLFHTSSNWGVSRAKVHVAELLRLPFPLPDQTHDPKRCQEIVRQVAQIITAAADQAKGAAIGRSAIVRQAQVRAEQLVEEYFDVDDIERMLIVDTNDIIVPSVRPTRARPDVPTIRPTNDAQRTAYTRLLCERLNEWARQKYEVHGRALADPFTGVGLVILEKTRHGERPLQLDRITADVLSTFTRLQRTASKGCGSLELVRGLKVFDKNLLYVTKPLGQRFWTNTAALNDADEIAAYILTRPAREGA